MFLWFLSLSVAGVFTVFRDPAIDYRLIGVGALLPDLATPLFGVGPTHSVISAVGFLSVVMLATVGRRRVRRRVLALPIGVFAHLVLDGAWASTSKFWWPIGGTVHGGRVPSFDRPAGIVVIQELIGLVVLIALVRTFGLDNLTNRDRFARSGRLDRSIR